MIVLSVPVAQPAAAPPAPLPRLKSGLLRDRAFALLRDAILAGRFQPGDPLREIPLAQELGVSQNTIREALIELQQAGLVTRTPNKNTTVTRLSPADIADRVTTRMMLEPLVCAAAASRMTESQFAGLRACLDRIAEAFRAGEPFETAQADLAFHRRIWELSQSSFLYQVLDQATLPLFAFVSLLRNRRRQTLEEILRPHKDIFRAMRARDGAELTRVIRANLRKSYQDVVPPGALSIGGMDD